MRAWVRRSPFSTSVGPWRMRLGTLGTSNTSSAATSTASGSISALTRRMKLSTTIRTVSKVRHLRFQRPPAAIPAERTVMFPLNIYRSGSGSVGRGSEHRADGLPVILDDLLAILFHSGMKEGTRRDNYDRSVRVLDGGSVLHHGTDIHQIVAVLIDGASEQSDKSPISQNALGDGIDQEAGIDQGFAGALALDGAFGELDERLSAGSLAADAALDLPDQEQRILDRRLTQGEGETGAGVCGQLRLGLVPVSETFNSHAAGPV
ncbi:hypothetical protein DESC_510021 [Desulfosarcina cetonica]|nr:hypothetical protein DESC_510021 [Desulfosarcina cetonica]